MKFFTLTKLCRTLMLAVVAVCVSNATAQETDGSTGTLTDKRDGKTYKTVKIDGDVWMAQNLNFQTGNSWCSGDDNSNCVKYGRLYNWNAAKTACPAGWFLPSLDAWKKLVKAVGKDVAGRRLKATTGWDKDGGGTDKYGFSALPGGVRTHDGKSGNIGKVGVWWTNTAVEQRVYNGKDQAYSVGISHDDVNMDEMVEEVDKTLGFSVRCLQD